jgi:hypothetical protein
MNRLSIFIFGVICLGLVHPTPSWSSATLPTLDISTSQASSFVKTVGLCMDNRFYLPANVIGSALGIDIGIEATLVQPPSDLGDTLGSLSASVSGSTTSTAVAVPFIPSIKLALHKSFGDRFQIGGSILPSTSAVPYIGGSILLGFDAQLVLYKPEEGLTWAIRGSYNYNVLTITQSSVGFSIKTNTISPQLVVSKRLDFAEPYAGAGFQYTWGSMQATATIPQSASLPLVIAPITIGQTGQGSSPFFFLGLAMRIPYVGFKITMEGSYNPGGMNYMGAKIGFDF